MKTITTAAGFTDSQNNALASGTLILQLSQPAEVTSGGGQVAPIEVRITLDASGKIPVNTQLWANDELTPAGTTYSAILKDSSNLQVANFGQWSITGVSPIDVSAMAPATSSVSYSGAVLLAPTGNQTITAGNLTLSTGNLTLTAGSLVETANAVTGTGGLVRKTSPTLITPTLGVATATSVNKVAITAPATSATLTIADGKTATVNNSLTLVGTDGTTHTFPNANDTVVELATTQTIQNKTFIGASSGNSVTLLNAQGATGTLTGNSADQVVYTYTLPANTLQTGKAIRASFRADHTGGTASVTYKLNFGTANHSWPTTATNVWVNGVLIIETGLNAQVYPNQIAITSGGLVTPGGAAINQTVSSNITVTLTFNVANTDTVVGQAFLLELVQ